MSYATKARPTNRLREASIPVDARHQGIIHDFILLNALRSTDAAQAAIDQAITSLRDGL